MVNRILSIPASLIVGLLIAFTFDGSYAVPLVAVVAFSLGFIGAYFDERQSTKDV